MNWDDNPSEYMTAPPNVTSLIDHIQNGPWVNPLQPEAWSEDEAGVLAIMLVDNIDHSEGMPEFEMAVFIPHGAPRVATCRTPT